MGLDVNTTLYLSKGIDVNSVQNVSSQILKHAQEQNIEPAVQNIDYSKFNRAALGIDLYSSRTNTDLQKQIALTQAGLYAKSVNVAKLNSQAALNLYSASTVQRQVELTQSVLQTPELIAPLRIEQAKNVVQTSNIKDKNSNSHNSFNPFQSGKEAEETNENK